MKPKTDFTRNRGGKEDIQHHVTSANLTDISVLQKQERLNALLMLHMLRQAYQTKGKTVKKNIPRSR